MEKNLEQEAMEHIMDNNNAPKTYSEILEPSISNIDEGESTEDYDYSYEDEAYDDSPLTDNDDDGYGYDEYGGDEEYSYGSIEEDYDEDDVFSYDDEDLSDNDILD